MQGGASFSETQRTTFLIKTFERDSNSQLSVSFQPDSHAKGKK